MQWFLYAMVAAVVVVGVRAMWAVSQLGDPKDYSYSPIELRLRSARMLLWAAMFEFAVAGAVIAMGNWPLAPVLIGCGFMLLFLGRQQGRRARQRR